MLAPEAIATKVLPVHCVSLAYLYRVFSIVYVYVRYSIASVYIHVYAEKRIQNYDLKF